MNTVETMPKIKHLNTQLDPFETAVYASNSLLDADTAIARIDELKNADVSNSFELGAALGVLRDHMRKDAIDRWLPEHTFDGVVDHMGLKRSTAYNLIKLYEVLTGLNLAWDDVKDIGRSRLYLAIEGINVAQVKLPGAYRDQARQVVVQNLDDARSMTLTQFQAKLKAKKSLAAPGSVVTITKEKAASAQPAPSIASDPINDDYDGADFDPVDKSLMAELRQRLEGAGPQYMEALLNSAFGPAGLHVVLSAT